MHLGPSGLPWARLPPSLPPASARADKLRGQERTLRTRSPSLPCLGDLPFDSCLTRVLLRSR